MGDGEEMVLGEHLLVAVWATSRRKSRQRAQRAGARGAARRVAAMLVIFGE